MDYKHCPGHPAFDILSPALVRSCQATEGQPPTINGKAELVVQDAVPYQRLLDIAAHADAREGVRQGIGDISRGRTRPSREVFDEIRKAHDIPR
jgi:hypothetical protein